MRPLRLYFVYTVFSFLVISLLVSCCSVSPPVHPAGKVDRYHEAPIPQRWLFSFQVCFVTGQSVCLKLPEPKPVSFNAVGDTNL